MALLEDQFTNLCHDYFDNSAYKSNEPKQVIQFLSNLLQNNKKIQITNEVRYFIPLLAQYKDGILCPVLESCVENISPLHFVPDLSLQVVTNKTKQKVHPPFNKNKQILKPAPRKKRTMYPQTARTQSLDQSSKFRTIDDIGSIPQLTIAPPQTARTDRQAHATEVLNNVDASLSTRRNLHWASSSIAKFKKPLPPLKETQNNVLPTLYITDKQNFFIAKKKSEDNLNFNILPTNYPDHEIGNQFVMLSSNGVIMTNGNQATVVDLGQFVADISNEFIVQNQSFRLRHSYRFFYTWIERYRNRLFRKIVHGFDSAGAISQPNFSRFLDKIRESFYSTTDDLLKVFPNEFDESPKSNDEKQNVASIGDETAEFADLTDYASSSIQKIDTTVRLLGEDTSRQIFEIFKNVRSANLLMQLNFEELHSLNSLPASLQSFAIDLKWRVPSLYRQRLRENILSRERKLAGKRQEYLRTFFTRVRTFYHGLLIMQCKRSIVDFLYRFSSRSQNITKKYLSSFYQFEEPPPVDLKSKIKVSKLVASFDSEIGIKIYPSRTLFINWFERTIDQIADAFLSDNKLVNSDVIADVDPEYEFEMENAKAILGRYPDIKVLKADALSNLNEVFDFIESDIAPHSNFLKRLHEFSDTLSAFSEFRNSESVKSMINNFLNQQANLSKRPRIIYHNMSYNVEVIDFQIDLKPSLEEATKFLTASVKIFKQNCIKEINEIFTEIQEKWVVLKDQPRISKDDVVQFEEKLVLLASLCDMVVSTWEESKSDVKATLDTVNGFYRGLNEKSADTSPDSITFFNRTCEKLGVPVIINPNVPRKQLNNDDDEYEYEYEEEEDTK